jgi:hypothetical protein
MKKSIGAVFLVFVFLTVLLSGCAPASTPVPPTLTPIPPTTTYTPIPSASTPKPTFTPIPTNTSEPTATEMPCTDMGWSDIDGSLKYFVAEVRNLEKLKSINAIMISVDANYIQGMIDGVTGIQVATCTQKAKDLVIAGMNAFLTYCQDLSSSSLDQAAVDKAKAQLAENKLTFIQANTELSTLGFKVSNLEYLANHFSNK